MFGRALPSIVLTVVAAGLVFGAETRPRSWHELDFRVRELTRAMMLHDSRALYRMFPPTFREDIDFARFDSSFRSWHRGRRAAIGRGEVVDTRGISGRASSWVVFKGEDDYDYVYQSWIHAADTWRVAWLSNILDETFIYGQGDSAVVRSMRAAALDWLIRSRVLDRLPPVYGRPDTVVVLSSVPALDWLPDYPTAVVTPGQFREGVGMPEVPYAFRFALTRSFGPVGVCVVDLLPVRTRRARSLDRERSIQVLLERVGDTWRFVATGAVW